MLITNRGISKNSRCMILNNFVQDYYVLQSPRRIIFQCNSNMKMVRCSKEAQKVGEISPKTYFMIDLHLDFVHLNIFIEKRLEITQIFFSLNINGD